MVVTSSPPDPYGWIRQAGALVSIPLILGLSPVVGGALGWVLDRSLGTRPIFTIGALIAGFIAGIRETWTLLQRVNREETRDAARRPPHK